jgi:hypothetical protein
MTPESLAKSGSEDAMQMALFCWAQQNQDKYPELKYLFHIPNGGFRDIRTAGKLRATGVKKGVPDICLPVKRGLFSGLWIELKKDYKAPISKEQEEWLDFLRTQGFAALVCVGWTDAKEVIECYLNDIRSGDF